MSAISVLGKNGPAVGQLVLHGGNTLNGKASPCVLVIHKYWEERFLRERVVL